ncbi:nuclear transport factor 2 family protein [Nonomuraea fuscirosea]|uniref:nuclear transport factor 2 family protein n=1 Tax=Nonomuraea fuscirosea TaxID=1291556 RepID=UPI00342F8B47
MTKIPQHRALLLAAIVPALLLAGCSANNQAMKGAASPGTPTDMDSMSPGTTDTATGEASPSGTAGGSQAESAVQGYFNALKAGNLDQVVSSFSDDAVVAVNGQATAEGSEAIRTLFQKLQGSDDMKQAKHTIDESRTAGDQDAFVRSTSKQGDDDYRELFLLTKDGEEWKISQFMNNQAS